MRARRIVPDTAAPRRRVGRSAGSLNLESALVVALLVLVAAFTLFSLGDSIACLYEREAHMANRIGFWASMPGVEYESSEGAADGTVTWEAEGTAEDDTFTILRMRPGDGADPEDHSTWADLGTFSAADRPVSGLDIRDGDYVVIAVDVERCGYGLIGPAWPIGGDPPPPPPPPSPDEGPGWYAGTFLTMAVDGDGKYTWADKDYSYIAAFDEDGNQLWDIPMEVEESDMESGFWPPDMLAVSDDTLFVYMDPSTEGDDASPGIYAYPGWRSAGGPTGEAELVIPAGSGHGTIVANDGTVYTLSRGMAASSDGLRLLFVVSDGTGDYFAAEYGVADQSLDLVPLPLGPKSCQAVSYGLDGHAYAFLYASEYSYPDYTYSNPMLYRLDGGAAVPAWSSGDEVLAVLTAARGLELSGVGPDGTAYLADWYGNKMAVSGDGSVIPMGDSGFDCGVYHLGFDSAGSPVEVVRPGDRDPETGYGSCLPPNDLRYAVPGGAGVTLKEGFASMTSDPLGSSGRAPYPLAFVSRMGNADIQPASPPPPPPPAGVWRYEILVNGEVAWSQDFTPADPDSVILNATVDSSELAYYGRTDGDAYVLPMIRATSHRTLTATGDGNSDYAEINSPGRVPDHASSMSTPWSNYYDMHEPSAGLSYWIGMTGEDASPGWAGSHAPVAGFWAESVEHGWAHATAIGRDDTALAKSLCISVVPKYQTASEERAGLASATYRMKAGLGIESGGELDPYRVMNIVYPMLPQAAAPYYQTPGAGLADMSLEIAGISWDDGTGKIPDSMLTYFGTDPGYPTVAAGSRGLLVMDTNLNGAYDHAAGDTILSYATRSKRSTIEVRITGGVVHEQKAQAPDMWKLETIIDGNVQLSSTVAVQRGTQPIVGGLHDIYDEYYAKYDMSLEDGYWHSDMDLRLKGSGGQWRSNPAITALQETADFALIIQPGKSSVYYYHDYDDGTDWRDGSTRYLRYRNVWTYPYDPLLDVESDYSLSYPGLASSISDSQASLSKRPETYNTAPDNVVYSTGNVWVSYALVPSQSLTYEITVNRGAPLAYETYFDLRYPFMAFYADPQGVWQSIGGVDIESVGTRLTTQYSIHHRDDGDSIPDTAIKLELADSPTPRTVTHRWTKVN